MIQYWPQILWIILAGMHFGIHVFNHGEYLRGKYNGIHSLIGITIVAFILYSGGFFK